MKIFTKTALPPLLRKSFSLEKPLRRATLYITGLGYYDLHVNGQKPDDRALDPGWTTYGKRVLYSTFDLTDQLHGGENLLAVELGNGWYNPMPLRMWGRYNLREFLDVGRPRLLARLNIEFADGSTKSIVTDSSWKTTLGPTIRNSVYMGEKFDARKIIPGWTLPRFDDSDWKPAVVLDAPEGRLQAQTAPPIRTRDIYEPVAITEPKPGMFVVDFGKNFSGVVELKNLEGPAGAEISIVTGERLYSDGTVNPMTAVAGQIKKAGMGGPGAPDVAIQKDVYILGGNGPETWRPKFTFHGFRYAQVTGFPERPTKKNFRGIHLGTDVVPAGRFECSNEMFNQIHELFIQTLTSNILSVQSDCPAREKFGYGGDLVSCSEAAVWNFDMATFYQKIVRDFQDAARGKWGFDRDIPLCRNRNRGSRPRRGPGRLGDGPSAFDHARSSALRQPTIDPGAMADTETLGRTA